MKYCYIAISVFPDKSMKVSKLFKTRREAAGLAESLNRSEPAADHYVMLVEMEED